MYPSRVPPGGRRILARDIRTGSAALLQALAAPPDVTPADRLGVTIFFAVLAHLIVILGVTFVPEERHDPLAKTLDVVLVPHRSEAAPDRADYLAQANADGGGHHAERDRPVTPAPAPQLTGTPNAAGIASLPPTPAPEPSAAPESSAATATNVREAPRAEAITVESTSQLARPNVADHSIGPQADLLRTARSERDATEGTSREPDMVPISTPTSVIAADSTVQADTSIATSRSREIAALSAEIERKLRTYAERPRRKWITARTREHAFAAYMDAWRRKVEYIGNRNYPDEATRRGLSGSLLLEVAVNSDGTVESITLRRSSGHPVLDDAAVRIVRLAAPFAKFPPGVAREVDVLHIERTWRFHSGNGFSSG